MHCETTITEWVDKFLSGKFDSPDIDTQIEAGWYDWHCKDYTLAKKTEKLGKYLLQIYGSYKFDHNRTYVFFKNNCPLSGDLYDDFRICDIATGNVLYTVVPKTGHANKKPRAEVYGKENDFAEPLVSGSWNDILKFFNRW